MKKLILVLCLSPGMLMAQSIIPQPTSIVTNTESFQLVESSQIRYNSGLEMEAKLLSESIKRWSGIELSILESREAGRGDIFLHLNASDAERAYSLNVDGSGVMISSGSSAGVFYGSQSLLQLISPTEPNTITGASVRDEPKYSWRGLMLDSSRHFQTVEEVKDFIDLMAHYKFNVFHWHLTDDQGWRIEIDSFPKLTSIGAWRVPREGIWWFRPGPLDGEEATYGGFYTKEEIKEVVAYAAERHVEVVPEVDVPGHSLALLSAYPQLSTTGGPFRVNPGSKFWNVIENTLDPSNPETYMFLDTIFEELSVLFPSEWIHVGGDEATKKFWKESEKVQSYMAEEGIENEEELQSHFIRKVEALLKKRGKKLIGWDEILEGGLAESATVMSWRGKAGGIKAASMGRNVIMSPAPEYYLDVLQGDPSIEPATYSMARLTDTYHFDPTLPDSLEQSRLLGLQGNLWTEEIPNQRHAQYMTWPRAFAISEAAWSVSDKKEWSGFVARVEDHFMRLDKMGVNYSRSIYDPSLSISEDSTGRQYIQLNHEIPGLSTYYTFDDTEPDQTYPMYKAELKVPIGAYAIRTRTYRDGVVVGRLTYSEIHRIGKGKRIPSVVF